MPRTAAALAPRETRRMDVVLAGVPALLHGFRVAGAVSLALYVAFALQLDHPSWAGTSAAAVCLPILGSSLRKAVFRMIGTATGAFATVLLTACFPQDRLCFLLGLAVWCGICGFTATLLRNFAAYAAMLAGYTMAIVASDSIVAPGAVFIIAVTRATEIGIGILSATLILAATAGGRAHQDFGVQLAGLISETLRGFGATLSAAGGSIPDSRPLRRELIRRAAALDSLIDQAAGESRELRIRRPSLETAVDGVFGALAGWRIVAAHLGALPEAVARDQAAQVVARLSPLLRGDVKATGTAAQQTEACRLACAQALRQLVRLKSGDVSLRLLADATAKALGSLEATCNGLLLIAEPALARHRSRPLRAVVADLLPALVNGLRVFAGIAAASLFWIVTAWPSGPVAITFVAVTMLLLAPRQEQGLDAALGFGLGTTLTAGLAAVVGFAILPNQEGFASLAFVIALMLVPLAALSTVPSLAGLFGAASLNFIPLLGPADRISFDTISFYNSTMGIVGGCIGGALMLRLIPPVSPAERARRLLDLTLADLRRLATGRRPMRIADWHALVHARLVAMPDGSELEDGARLVAALSVGTQVIGLRRFVQRLTRPLARNADAGKAIGADVDGVLRALAHGEASRFIEGSMTLERTLARLQDEAAEGELAPASSRGFLRARAAILIMVETMRIHGDYLGASPR